MKSSFLEYSIATSGLQVARLGLATTSNNVANASNKGYSRQYIEQRASRPLGFNNGRGMYGTGAEVYGVGQYRSMYLDKKYWHENSIRGEYSLKTSQLSLMESVLSGMGDSGLTTLFDGFFMSMQDLTQNAGDATYRTNVITSAQSLAKQINSSFESLKKQQADINAEIGSMVQVVNSLGSQIASLNKQISLFELDGSRANDLRDQRVRLVDQLSQYVNVDIKEEELSDDYALGKYPEPEDRGRSVKKFSVLINGEEFVSGDSYMGLRVQERKEKLNPLDEGGLFDIYFANSNKQLDLYSQTMTGELKALIDLRDGNNSYYAQGTVKSYDTSSYELVMACTNKLDLGETGYIEVTDPRTGARVQYSYKDLEYTYDTSTPPNITGVKLTLTDPPKDPKQIQAGATSSIGRSTSYKGIPHYINKLNEMVRTFAKALNQGANGNGGHVDGYDAYGNPGGLFFTYNDDPTNWNSFANTGNVDYLKMNAQNFAVNPALIKDPLKLACSTSDNPEESNNKMILQLIELKNFRGLFKEGKLEDYIIGMMSELGIDARQAQSFENNYSEVITYVDNQREAFSGVNIDEEMAAMIRYQQLYQAAAKLVNVIDSIYDTCINRMGVR